MVVIEPMFRGLYRYRLPSCSGATSSPHVKEKKSDDRDKKVLEGIYQRTNH